MKPTTSFPLLLTAVYLLAFGTRYLDPALLGTGDTMYLSLVVLQLAVFLLPGIFYCRMKGEGYSVRLNFRPFSPRKLLFILASFLTLLAGVLVIRRALVVLDVVSFRYSIFDSRLTLGIHWDDPRFWYVLIAYAAMPALCEEFIFRSVLMREYTDACGEVTAVVMSTLSYAMLSLTVSSFFESLFVGFMLACVTAVTRTVLPAMLMRVFYNIFGILTEGTVRTLLNQAGGAFLTVILLTLLLLAMFFAFSEGDRLCRWYASVGTEPPAPTAQPCGRLYEALFSPTFLVAAAVCIAAVILL